ncbi:MAG: hypothetical protein JO316_06990 [Abitibacteriaceae bacterium]|nr:hypothetical protein [Abditibacteriaceae bacterium]
MSAGATAQEPSTPVTAASGSVATGASPTEATGGSHNSPSPQTPSGAAQTGKGTPPIGVFTAGVWHYIGGVLVAEGENGQPVRYESGMIHITAQKIWLQPEKKEVRAEGDVLVEYTHETSQSAQGLRSGNLPERHRRQTVTVTDTFKGSNFQYNYSTQQGHLDNATVHITNLDASSSEVIINGQRYTIHNVLLRPGGLTEAERKIYGTPPFNLRAKTVVVNTGTTANEKRDAGIVATGAKLYYNNHAILPVPSYVFGHSGRGLFQHRQSAFSVTPSLTLNKTDGVLVTTSLRYPLSSDPRTTALTADIGVSTRVGFRGGLSLNNNTHIGTFSLRGRKNDIVTTQLTNRIILDRAPEVEFDSPRVRLFNLPGGQRAGVAVGLVAGHYNERNSGFTTGHVQSSRTAAEINFTTRMAELDGPYLELFARTAHYAAFSNHYNNAGFEVGYDGSLGSRIRGLLSYRSIKVTGQTPFRFDLVEIAREVRTTLDLEATPRYIVPIDLRYDLDQRRLRDSTFGLLRSYKVFAYGLVYQSAHRELRLEVREGF